MVCRVILLGVSYNVFKQGMIMPIFDVIFMHCNILEQDVGNMKDSWFFDKNFNGLSDEAFDDVVNFFDFPLEDVDPNVVEEDWDAEFKRLEEPCFDVFSVSSSGLCGKTQNEKPQLGRSFSASVTVSILVHNYGVCDAYFDAFYLCNFFYDILALS